MFNFRVVIFLVALVFGVAFSIPSILQLEKGKKITLGLDLQGGLHMLLGVKSQEAIASKMSSAALSMEYMLNENDIIFDKLKLRSNVIVFDLLDGDDLSKTKTLLSKSFKEYHIVNSGNHFEISMSPMVAKKTKEQAINQAVETIRTRLDAFGLAEPTVAKQGKDKILVEVPGIKTQEDEQRIRKLIAKAAHLEIVAVDEQHASRVDSMSEIEAKHYGDVILPDVQGKKRYLLRSVPLLDGSMLVNAQVGYDQNNRPLINFELNSRGAKIFGDFTGKNIGRRTAIVLDKRVYSAPVIQSRIGGGRVQITGNFELKEASDIAIALRSGALLAPVYVLEKRSVGPSLGADNIKASLMALILGFVLVVIFMIVYYRVAGVIANIALIANLALIIAIMSLFGATLTLPGMAGIVLTVGMAVDANVIINERIRELLHEGKSFAKAIEEGYKNAFTAIWDANITTLIAATVLYAYGTGPIKGFALTMSIGILASMLTAIVGTHGFYEALLPKMDKKRVGFWFGIKKEEA